MKEVTASVGLGKEEKMELEGHFKKYLWRLTSEREFALVNTTRVAGSQERDEERGEGQELAGQNCFKFVRLPNKEICLEAQRKIKPDEELTVDYGAGYFGR